MLRLRAACAKLCLADRYNVCAGMFICVCDSTTACALQTSGHTGHSNNDTKLRARNVWHRRTNLNCSNYNFKLHGKTRGQTYANKEGQIKDQRPN